MLLGGCAANRGSVTDGPTEGATGRRGASELVTQGQVFAPAQVSIFPLTQLEVDDNGDAWLLLFIELRDRWSDPVKAVGWLTVYLEPVSTGVDTTGHDARWDVDLTDASVNSALFDPVTRTYRFQLGGLPERAQVMANRAANRRSGDASAERSTLLFRASFRTLGPRGEEIELWDAFELES